MNKNNQIKVYDFTKPEIDYILSMANFSPPEREFFNLRNEYLTLEQAAERMNISPTTAYRINKKMKFKILKVLSKEY